MASFGDFNRVNTNVSSLGARLSLNKINSELGDSRLKLSTGKRINSAEDNSAGYAIATKLNSRVKGLEQAVQNISDAKSMLDVVENAYNSIIDNLIKLKSLATKAASGTIATGSDEMAYLASQMEAIGDEINEIADKTTFNGKDLIGSSENDTFSIQTGEGNSDTMDIGLSEISMKNIFPNNTLRYPSSYGTFFEDFNDGDLSNFNHNGGTVGGVDVRGGSFDGSNMLYLAQGANGITFDTKSSFGYGVYSYKFKINGANNAIVGKLMGTDLSTFISKNDEKIRMIDTTTGVIVDDNLTIDVGTWYEAEIEIDSDSAKLRVDNQLIEIELSNEFSDGVIHLRPNAYNDNLGINIDNISYTPNDENIVIDANTVTNSDMRDLVNNVDNALETMNSKVNELGINQRSLSSKEENLTQAITANSAAHSRIIDTDFAKEQSNSIRLQILQQTATAALSQANMGPQAVLGFLGQ